MRAGLPLILKFDDKSANIVFDDAYFDIVTKGSTKVSTFQSGQWCAVGTRLLVQEGIYDRFA